jgi:DNA polymerase III epsilon subunit-like protein
MFIPFSSNIVFIDTEFSDLNPYTGELLSIALIKPSGEELYIELEYDGPVSDWVKEHVLPIMRQEKVNRDEAKKLIREFLGDSKPNLLGFICQYDDVFLSKLFLNEEKPYYYVTLDLASMFFAHDKPPEHLYGIAKEMGLDATEYKEHNALDDTRLIRDIYQKLIAV